MRCCSRCKKKHRILHKRWQGGLFCEKCVERVLTERKGGVADTT